MYYPEEIIERVRQGNDIVEVISSHVKLKRTGNNYVGLCPFHSEKTPSFSVSRGKQFYHCFGCGKSGNVITFLMEYEGMGFLDAVKELAGRAGVSLPEMEQTEESRKKADFRNQMMEACKEAARYYYYRLKKEPKAMEYFKGRKLTEETILKFGLGYAPVTRRELYDYLKQKGFQDEVLKECGLVRFDEKSGARDYFFHRVMFPIMDANSRVIAFGGRVLGDGEPKYLNSPESRIFDKSRNLYGLFLARKSRRKEFLLCEGYMDVIALHQAGFDNAVASLGTAFTMKQAGLIKRYTDTVLLTYDSDGAGKKAALRAVPMLREAGITAKVVDMSPYKDPDEFIKNLGAGAYEERIEQAKAGFYFETDVLENGFDMNDPGQKTKFLHAVAEKLLDFEEDLERNTYLEAVAKRYQIQAEDLRKVVASLAMKLAGRKPAYVPAAVKETRLEKKISVCEKVQSLFFTLAAEDVSVFQDLDLTPDDFYGEPYHEVAKLVFAQYEQTGQINPAAILDSFSDIEEHHLVSRLFFDQAAGYQEMSERDRQWLVSDLYKKIKENSTREKQKEALLRKMPENGQDANEIFRQMVRNKKKTEQLRQKKR